MKNFRYTIVLAVLLSASSSSFAQAVIGSYFIDRSFQRTAFNPAFSPESNYISLPVMGGFQAGISSNYGLDNFLFHKDGTLYTYLNKNVPVDEFCGKLKNDPTNFVGADFKVLGFGFHLGKYGYLSFDADVVVDAHVTVPKELFYLTKMGMPKDGSGNVYNLSSMNLTELAYLQAGVAFSFDFSALVPGLKVGARVRYAALAEAVEAKANNVQLYMTENEWKIKTDAEGHVVTEAITYDPETKQFKTSGKYNVAGGGLLFDFGAEYRIALDCGPINGVNVAASVSNVGRITAKNPKFTTFKSAGEAAFKGMSDVKLDTDFDERIDAILNEFSSLANFEKVESREDYVYKFSPRIFASAELALFQNKLTTGVIYSNRYGFNELTMSVNGKLGGFNASVSYNFITAKSFGFFLSFIPKGGVSIFIGSDCIPTKFTPQWVPINLNADFRMGVSIVFGHRDR